MARKLPPVHPGEILREEFLVSLKLTPYAVAAALNVPRTRIERIAREEKPVTADTALRLGKFFRTGCVLDEHSGALRSRNSRRRAGAADQEDRALRGGVTAKVLGYGRTEPGGAQGRDRTIRLRPTGYAGTSFHRDFQSHALPTELPRHAAGQKPRRAGSTAQSGANSSASTSRRENCPIFPLMVGHLIWRTRGHLPESGKLLRQINNRRSNSAACVAGALQAGGATHATIILHMRNRKNHSKARKATRRTK
jgi:addiction module HigA family antidote